MTETGLTGVVLAGGGSRRMGQNKALLAVGNEKVIGTIIGAMTEAGLEVIIAANEQTADDYRELGRGIVYDRFPGQGPLSGIHAALHAAKTPWIIVAACDMPFVSPALFRYLVKSVEEAEAERADGDGYQAIIPVEAGRVQPLLAAYHASGLGALEDALGGGRLRMMDWLERLRVRYIPEDVLAEETGLKAGQAFFNMNHPEDYHAALAKKREEEAWD
ncbi:molybdenum cofactor guanylyltransferase [Paenibacillus sp. USDA918EY]|uniref:molybdenum cofactor guanylyltransferase n=1 Tax=Paenibacillus sp. USDA918EY TaxID=2689575 RepID=UPI0013598191|nr:molybdenum cofactor guanylyltransferase [Paenibacillus sp. USDA918EY]